MIVAHVHLFVIYLLRIFKVGTAFNAEFKFRRIFVSTFWTFHRKSLLIVKIYSAFDPDYLEGDPDLLIAAGIMAIYFHTFYYSRYNLRPYH